VQAPSPRRPLIDTAQDDASLKDGSPKNRPGGRTPDRRRYGAAHPGLYQRLRREGRAAWRGMRLTPGGAIGVARFAVDRLRA
jgi:hypothetical protein